MDLVKKIESDAEFLREALGISPEDEARKQILRILVHQQCQMISDTIQDIHKACVETFTKLRDETPPDYAPGLEAAIGFHFVASLTNTMEKVLDQGFVLPDDLSGPGVDE